MPQPLNEHDVRKYLAAFADGELDVEENLKVLEHMTMNPQATRRAMHQQQLRQLVDRSLRTSGPRAPDALRARIEKLAAHTHSDHDDVVVAGRVGRRWWPLAVAAMVVVSASVIVFNTMSARPSVDGIVADESITMNVSDITRFAGRHVSCASMQQTIRDSDKFPKQVNELPGALGMYLGKQTGPNLDLSQLGYTFYAAGKCNVPGERSVHMVYHSTAKSGRRDAISLWIRVYDDIPVGLESGKLYQVRQTGSHPMLVWRQGELIYYLVGDSVDQVQQAGDALLRG